VDPLDLQEPVLLPSGSVQCTAATAGVGAPASNATPSLSILEILLISIRATTKRPTFEPRLFFIRSYVGLYLGSFRAHTVASIR
jgi:hypothetical protein